MTDKNFVKLCQFRTENNCLIPLNDLAIEICTLGGDEVINLLPVTPRDGKFHRVYFAFISECWEYIPKDRKPCKKENYYNYLKLVQGLYDIEYVEINDVKIPMIEFQSISYNNMDEVAFVSYVKNQISVIYSEFHKYFAGFENPDQFVNDIINTLEQNFKNLMYRIR